jgi:uncharacterized protein
MSIDDPRVVSVLQQCESMNVPAVVHCGRQPATQGYGVNPLEICGVQRAVNVLEKLPRLKLVVPHLGIDEFTQYLSLLERFENLYLDTAMACSEYFHDRPAWADVERFSDRIAFGTDFPIVPYEPDRELKVLARRITSDDAFENLVRNTARKIWGS